MYPQMLLKTKLVQDGNSWALRLPKTVLKLSGLKPGGAVQLEVRPDRIVIYPGSKTINKDKYQRAAGDARQVLNKALDDAWLEIFGLDE
jgi:antitoxin component of MazEF toxin-antitoxin module